jgi:hypothetical protein
LFFSFFIFSTVWSDFANNEKAQAWRGLLKTQTCKRPKI